MRHLSGFLLPLCFLFSIHSSAQPWQELLDQAEKNWGKNWPLCQEVMEKALVLVSAEQGTQDSIYASILNELGSTYSHQGMYERALDTLYRCMEIKEQLYEEGNFEFATTFNNIATVHKAIGNYELAEKNLQEALKNVEQNLGKKHFIYGIATSNMAMFYDEIGQFARAIPLQEAAIKNSIATVGKEHHSYAANIHNLAGMYRRMGRYEEALALLIQVSEHAQTHGSPYMAQFSDGIANIHKDMGEYDKALPFYRKALELIEKEVGKNHIRYASRLNNLALLYKRMGQYTKALELYLESTKITAATVGKQHGDYGDRLNNLAVLYDAMGEYDKALEMHKEALKITRETKGEENPKYANTLHNMGSLYLELGEPEKALEMVSQAREIALKALSSQNVMTGRYTMSMGMIHRSMGNLDQAREYYQEALEYAQQNLGVEHAEYGRYVLATAAFYVEREEYEAAKDLFLEFDQTTRFQVQHRFASLSQAIQQTFLANMLDGLHRFQSFSLNHPEYPELLERGLEQQLWVKGLLLGNTQKLLQSLRKSEDSTIVTKYQQWESLHTQLARQYQRPVAKRIVSFDSLKNLSESLELDLAKESRLFQQAQSFVQWVDIQAHMKEGDLVVEFSRFPYADNDKETDSVLYIAYLLRKGDEAPQVISLCNEQVLQQLLSGSKSGEMSIHDQLYATRGIRPGKASYTQLVRLKELIIDPLSEQLDGIKRIYFSPAGLLHRINLGAIPIGKKQHLSDQYEVIQLSSTRSLAFNNPVSIPTKTALLLGGIQYDQMKPGAESVDSLETETGLAGIAIVSRGLTAQWSYLSGTQQEVETIAQLLKENEYQVESCSGLTASEERLRNKQVSSQILHIATHGYFFPDPSDVKEEGVTLEKTSIQLSEHPMVRSGLILAAANHAWAGNPVPEGEEDGILTAYEISRMDLSHTELVVLSACETGLGDIQGNEGVYGLQRAFKIAGAKYVLMSLWQVPDQATQELMTTFYENWLGGMEIRQALQTAQNQIRKTYKDPYYWAGFVLVE